MADFFLDDDDPTTTLQQLSKKRQYKAQSTQQSKKVKKNEESDDELDKNVNFGDYSSDEELPDQGSSSEEEKESATEKRLRLAKNYLTALESQESFEKIDDAKAGMATKLKEEAQEAQGKLIREIASELKEESKAPKVIRVLRGHQLPPTCVAVSEDGTTAFSGSKDCSIIQWDIETGKKMITKGGRRSDSKTSATGQVLSIAVTSDKKFYATGGRDNLVRIWDTQSNSMVHSFKGHRGAVTALKFRKDSYQLFSGSEDRSIKIWNLDPMMYAESLYGHQSGVMGLDSLYKERTVSCGEDRTCRIWKIVEESQLLYRGHTAAIDCLSLVNEEVFVAGSQDGALSLWHAGHKRPNFVFNKAHGPTSPWISSVCALPFTDLVASGSNDGNLNFWQFSKTKQIISRVCSVPMPGFINSIAVPLSGKFLLTAVGQEHRLGRWSRDKTAKNSIQIVSLPFNK